MTGMFTSKGALTPLQKAAVHRIASFEEQAARALDALKWYLTAFVAGLGLVVGIDFSIAFSVMWAAAVPGTPTAMIALKACVPLLAICVFWVLDQRIIPKSAPSRAIKRLASWLAPAVPMGIGLYLGYEVFLSANEVIGDGGLGPLFGTDEPRLVTFMRDTAPVFALILATVVAGFFSVSSYFGHYCLTRVAEIMATWGQQRGRARLARELVRQIMDLDARFAEKLDARKRLLDGTEGMRSAIDAVIAVIDEGLRGPEHALTALMLEDGANPSPHRPVLTSALPEQARGWSIKALKARIAEIRALADPTALRAVFAKFNDTETRNAS